METKTPCKILQISNKFDISLTHVYDYSLEIFGFLQAERYREKVRKALYMLPYRYLVHPECRHIPTKSQMYRNIILDSHLIIYRITDLRIEVLDIVYSASGISKIRETRKIFCD